MGNVVARRILLGIYLFFGILTDVMLLSSDLLLPKAPAGQAQATVASSLGALLAAASILGIFLGFGLFLFIILFFRYRARYLMLYLLPFFGGLIFAVWALFSKKAPQDFWVDSKTWNIFALLGLFGLDQTTGGFIMIFASSSEVALWQIILDVLLFAGTLAYFIYWGIRRAKAKWSFRNIWRAKWGILLTIVAMIAWTYFYSWIMSVTGLKLPTGDNQTAINQVAQHIPAWLMWMHLALGAPIMEETIFRAGVFELISPKYPKIALVVSALAFNFVHMMNGSILDWRVWLIYMIPGFALAGLYYKTRKVEATATVHFLWNGVASYLLP